MLDTVKRDREGEPHVDSHENRERVEGSRVLRALVSARVSLDRARGAGAARRRGRVPRRIRPALLPPAADREAESGRLVLQDEAFAAAIFEAEAHPYFSGQVRSALQFAETGEGVVDRGLFEQYWGRIAALFEKSGPKQGRLLRQALLSFDDYTLGVGHFKTLCVNDPNEGERTPSLKRLFSDHSARVRPLLDELSADEDIEPGLEAIVAAADVPAHDWRRCFLDHPSLFGWMSTAHLRLREVDGEMLIIPNKSSNGYNYQLFLAALMAELQGRRIKSYYSCEQGTRAEHSLNLDEEGRVYVRFENGRFSIHGPSGDGAPVVIFESTEDDPVRETADRIAERLLPEPVGVSGS